MAKLVVCCITAALAVDTVFAMPEPTVTQNISLKDDDGLNIHHVHTRPVVLPDGDLIVVAGPRNEFVYRLVAQQNYAVEWRTDIDLYEYTKSTFDTHVTTPVADVENGFLYAGDQAGHFHKVTLATGQEIFDYPYQDQGIKPSGGTAGAISSLTMANGFLYFGSIGPGLSAGTAQYNMHAYAPSGTPKWQRLEKYGNYFLEFQNQPVVSDGIVYFVNSKSRGIPAYLFAVNETDGTCYAELQLLWVLDY